MEPNFILARVTLGLNQEQLGLTKEAIAEFRKFGETDPTDVATTAALGHALVKNGRTAEARIILSDLRERAKEVYVPPYRIAVLYAGPRRGLSSSRLA